MKFLERSFTTYFIAVCLLHMTGAQSDLSSFGACVPQCKWSDWCDGEKANPPRPLFKDENENKTDCEEHICENPVDIECVTMPDELPHHLFTGVDCNLETGLHCDVSKAFVCPDFKIRYKCCNDTCTTPVPETTTITPTETPSRQPTTRTTEITTFPTTPSETTTMTPLETTVTTAETTVTTSKTTAVTACVPQCEWSDWCDGEKANPPRPLFKDENENKTDCEEHICENPVDIECVTMPDELPHHLFTGVDCNLETGLHCDVSKAFVCPDFKIRYKCCNDTCTTPVPETTTITPTETPSRQPTTRTTEITTLPTTPSETTTVTTAETTAVTDCDESSQCLLEELQENVICKAAPFGFIDPPCYGHWSSFSSCNCSDPYYRISSSGSTYWCENDGHFNSKLYDVECFAPCIIDASTKAVSKNSDGVITSTIKDGDYVTYTCPEGYTSSGDNIVACKDGMWNKHNIFECYGNCNAPDNYKFVDPPNSNTVIEGTVVSMRCNDGYLPSDTIVRTCKNETFGDVPECHAEFCERLSLTDDSVIVTPDQTTYPEDTTVYFSCPAGFELHGDSSAVCHHAEWLFSIEPTCVVSCSPSCSWSNWCDDEPSGTKFIPIDEYEDENSCGETICDNPVNIECVTVSDGVPHHAFPGVTCDLSTGLHCDVSLMGICSNFQIRYECCVTC